MNKNLVKFLILVGATMPGFALAVGDGFNNISTIISQVARIITQLIPLAFGLAILGFFWGLVKYIFAQSSEEAKADGKKIMLWAMVALFVMASVFGIINLAQGTLGVTNNNPIQPPTVNIQRY